MNEGVTYNLSRRANGSNQKGMLRFNIEDSIAWSTRQRPPISVLSMTNPTLAIGRENPVFSCIH